MDVLSDIDLSNKKFIAKLDELKSNELKLDTLNLNTLNLIGTVNAINRMSIGQILPDTKGIIPLIPCKNGSEDCDNSYNYGVYGDYLSCAKTLKKISQRVIHNLSKNYQFIKPLGGGKSGAYVFLVKDLKTSNTCVLKLYAMRILKTIQDRDIREIFTACSLSGTSGFPIVYDYGVTYYNNIEDKNYWEEFKRAYIDCVGNEGFLIKNYDFLNPVYFLVTSLSSGKILESMNLLNYDCHQLISIIYNMCHIFNNAQNRIPGFIHNDVHPGNIFVDIQDLPIEDLEDVPYTGSTITIIDFDLSRSPYFNNNISVSRETYSTILIQESVIKMLNKWLGMENTLKIIYMTKQFHQDVDFRLWYIYKILFEIIIFFKINYSDKIIDDAIDPTIVKDKILPKIKIDNDANFQKCEKILYFSDIKYFNKWNIETKNNFVSLNYHQNIPEYFLSIDTEKITAKYFDIIYLNIFKTFLGISFEFIGDDDQKNIINNRYIVDFIKTIAHLDTVVYEKSFQNFGLHNFKLTIKIQFSKETIIPLYDTTGGRNNLKIITNNSNDKPILQISYDSAYNIIIDLKNISVDFSSTNTSSNWASLLLLSQINRIQLNLQTGKININANGFIPNLFFNTIENFMWGIGKNIVICPGKKFDLHYFNNDILPLIINIIRYVTTNKYIKESTIELSDINNVASQIVVNDLVTFIETNNKNINNLLLEKFQKMKLISQKSTVNDENINQKINNIYTITKNIRECYKNNKNLNKYISNNLFKHKILKNLNDDNFINYHIKKHILAKFRKDKNVDCQGIEKIYGNIIDEINDFKTNIPKIINKINEDKNLLEEDVVKYKNKKYTISIEDVLMDCSVLYKKFMEKEFGVFEAYFKNDISNKNTNIYNIYRDLLASLPRLFLIQLSKQIIKYKYSAIIKFIVMYQYKFSRKSSDLLYNARLLKQTEIKKIIKKIPLLVDEKIFCEFFGVNLMKNINLISDVLIDIKNLSNVTANQVTYEKQYEILTNPIKNAGKKMVIY